jgi:hypothetical protein
MINEIKRVVIPDNSEDSSGSDSDSSGDEMDAKTRALLDKNILHVLNNFDKILRGCSSNLESVKIDLITNNKKRTRAKSSYKSSLKPSQGSTEVVIKTQRATSAVPQNWLVMKRADV